LDEAQILNSLQKPRKISMRGSDGKIYNALCKPKDDLRKDQRLMEFNNMINRFLKRDVESSKRRMCKLIDELWALPNADPGQTLKHTL
jgi:serine/threonine-protein kinase ATR